MDITPKDNIISLSITLAGLVIFLLIKCYSYLPDKYSNIIISIPNLKILIVKLKD